MSTLKLPVRAPAMPTSAQQILRLPNVVALVGLSRTTILRLISLGQFPQPIKLTERSLGWRLSEVEEYLATREKKAAPAAEGGAQK